MNLYVDIKSSFSEIESAYVTRSKTAPHERESKFKEKGEKQEDRKWDPVGKLLPPSTSKAVQVAEVFADWGMAMLLIPCRVLQRVHIPNY